MACKFQSTHETTSILSRINGGGVSYLRQAHYLHTGNLVNRHSPFTGQCCLIKSSNITRSPNVGLALVQRLRRWTNAKPTLGESVVFAGGVSIITQSGR